MCPGGGGASCTAQTCFLFAEGILFHGNLGDGGARKPTAQMSSTESGNKGLPGMTANPPSATERESETPEPAGGPGPLSPSARGQRWG